MSSLARTATLHRTPLKEVTFAPGPFAPTVALVTDGDTLLPDPHSGLPAEYLSDQAQMQAYVCGREAGWLGEPPLDEGQRDVQLGHLPWRVEVAWYRGHAAGSVLRAQLSAPALREEAAP